MTVRSAVLFREIDTASGGQTVVWLSHGEARGSDSEGGPRFVEHAGAYCLSFTFKGRAHRQRARAFAEALHEIGGQPRSIIDATVDAHSTVERALERRTSGVDLVCALAAVKLDHPPDVVVRGELFFAAEVLEADQIGGES